MTRANGGHAHPAAVTYSGGNTGRAQRHVLALKVMRSRSSVVTFICLCGASGVGVYLGGAIAGLVAVISGTAGSPWLHLLPGLVIVGAGVGLVVGWLTRRWLLPDAPRRRLASVVVGVVTLPLFAAVSQLASIESVGVPLVVAGGLMTTVVYWRATHRTPSGLGRRSARR